MRADKDLEDSLDTLDGGNQRAKVGRLALEPELEGLGAGRAAELVVADQPQEELVGELGDLELVLLHELKGRAEDIGLALEQGR